MRALLFYAGAAGFAGGIFFRSFFDIGFSFGFLLLFVGAIAVLLSMRVRHALTIAIIIAAAGLGYLRLDFADQKEPQAIKAHAGSRVSLTGIVVDEPDERLGHTKLTFEIRNENDEKTERVLVTTELHPRFAYGDELAVAGKLELPGVFEEEGRVFDYASYLRKESICCVMYYPTVEKTGEGKGNPLVAALFGLKHAFLDRVGRVVPEPEDALLAGLVVGAKQSLGPEYLDVFRRVGIIHIVVLSGYNLMIVARFLMRMLNFKFLSVGVRTGAGIAGIVLFALMTGASATTVRASGMAILSLLAKATSRLYLVTRALVLAGLLMLIVNPYLLVFDASFELSFLATVGLIYFSPWFERKFAFIPERAGLREIAAATVATQLVVLPLLLYQTGLFSLVSLPVNLLVLPIIPPAMLFGFLTGLAGFLSVTLSLPFAYLSHALLSYIFLIAEWFDSLPFAAYDLGIFPAWVMTLVYAALVSLLFWRTKKH